MPACRDIPYVLDKLNWMRAERMPIGRRYTWTDAFGVVLCAYRKPHPASEQTANRVMLVPDDRFSHVAGMRADQALPIEGTA